MFAAIKIDLANGDIKGIKLALKLDVELNSIKDLARGLIFYGFVDKSTCKYAIPFLFFFFIIAKKTVGFDGIFVPYIKKYNFPR